MKTLYVLYDHTCGLCCRAVHRLAHEPKYVELKFFPIASMAAQDRFGALLAPDRPDQVIAIADTGEFYRGSSAWLIVLFCLKRYRSLSIRLSRPGWRHMVDRAVGVVSRRRLTISEFLSLTPDADVIMQTRLAGPHIGCDGGACALK